MDSSSCHSPVAMVTAPSESCSPYPDSRSTHEAVHHSPCMQKPFFSIIIPAYNLENYIAATLQSVLVQTFQDFEIIIVDDGSSDETVSIIQSFHDPRIRLVSQVNGGVSRARNAGMKKAMGAYIAFLDGDDYWYPEHLELAADFFNRHPEILAYANRYMRDELEAIPPRPPSYPESIRRLGIRGVLFMNSSSVILNSSLASRLPPLGRSDALWGRRPVLDTVHAGDRPDRAGRLRHLHLQAESFFRHA